MKNKNFIEALWVILGYGGMMIGSLVLIKVLTNYLSPAVFGQLALALTVVGFGQTIIYGGWNFTAARFFPQLDNSGKLKAFLRFCIRVVLGLSVAWTFVLIIFSVILLKLGFREISITVLFVLPFSIFSGLFNMLNVIQNARRDRKGAALFQSGEVWLRILIVLLAIKIFGVSALVVISAYTASIAILACLALLNLFRAYRLAGENGFLVLDIKEKSILLSYSWPFYLWGPFVWAQQSIDRWALGAFSGSAEIGIYAAVMQVSFAPIRIILTMFVRFITPIAFGRVSSLQTENSRHASLKFLTKIGGAALFMTFVLFGATLLWRDFIFLSLTGPDFADGANYLPWMILAAGIIATSNILSLRLMGGQDVSHLIVPNILPSLVGVVLSVLGAWAYGVWGVVASQLCFGVLQLALISHKTWNINKTQFLNEE